ncbi:hypothetical protein [Nannocystis punicea]|uniref:Uncharacterized protein n=1 Tax=Nannocystis punicea TaxID=2995304 RepID=A0ABY7HB23_9BACT|nr:hypothetical protein [Nannocystis poenicansa]WAS96461.1 hypothetical protein O0S08_09905 [Nannocystis poenicansa]
MQIKPIHWLCGSLVAMNLALLGVVLDDECRAHGVQRSAWRWLWVQDDHDDRDANDDGENDEQDRE